MSETGEEFDASVRRLGEVRERNTRKFQSELIARLGVDDSTRIEAELTCRQMKIWECLAERGQSRCSIRCWNDEDITHYTLRLERDSDLSTKGETTSLHMALDAVEEWLGNSPLSRLYELFAFIDAKKRALLPTQQAIVALVPELVNQWAFVGGERDGLKFSQGERACVAFFGGDGFPPHVTITGDAYGLGSCEFLSVDEVASFIKLWLCDQVMPSQMKREFPSMEIGEMATYYEQERGWEGVCMLSWKWTEEHYRRMPRAERYLNLVAQIKGKGFEQTLHAGTSMFTLILSRSKTYGLRNEQSYVAFSCGDEGMKINARIKDAQHLIISNWEITPEVEFLLKKLEGTEID
jgi:hypothetical protein